MIPSTTQDTLFFNGSTIAYNVVRSRKRKTIGIAVYPSGEVRVSVPQRMGEAEVRRLVAEKAGWVDRKLRVILSPGMERERRASVAREAVLAWYRFHAEMAVDRAMPGYCRKLGILPPHYRVKNLQRRWGSCTAGNRLSFNAKIAMAPPPQLEYVVAHELCHVKIKDHSPRFWALMESVMPDYMAARKALRKDGWKYEL